MLTSKGDVSAADGSNDAAPVGRDSNVGRAQVLSSATCISNSFLHQTSLNVSDVKYLILIVSKRIVITTSQHSYSRWQKNTKND